MVVGSVVEAVVEAGVAEVGDEKLGLVLQRPVNCCEGHPMCCCLGTESICGDCRWEDLQARPS